MSVISRIDPVQAKLDPERAFASPDEILDHAGMTRAQKISAIGAWRFAIEQRLAASSEGMQAEGANDKDVRLLEAVMAVEAALREGPEASS